MTGHLEPREAPGCRRAGRAGFTLIEVVVALVVASIIVVTGRELLNATAEGSRRIHAASHDATREANAELVLRELVGRMEIGSTLERGFGGTEREAVFTSWCDVPGGWVERCRVSVAIDSVPTGIALVLTMRSGAAGEPSGERIMLRRDFGAGALRYLSSASDGGVWFRSWGHGITAPLAIAIITGADTTIVPIGERG